MFGDVKINGSLRLRNHERREMWKGQDSVNYKIQGNRKRNRRQTNKQTNKQLRNCQRSMKKIPRECGSLKSKKMVFQGESGPEKSSRVKTTKCLLPLGTAVTGCFR